MALSMSLEKVEEAAKGLRLSMEKSIGNTPPAVDVKFILDVSGSFHDEHVSGITNQLMNRLFPWAYAFDPDKKMECYTFSNQAAYIGDITIQNYQAYIQQQIINQAPGYGCGTDYAPVLELVTQKNDTKSGLFNRVRGLFGGKPAQPAVIKPSIVFFVTDGDNDDKMDTRFVMDKINAAGHPTYFKFVGVNNRPREFAFLQELADKYPNVDFLSVTDIKKFVSLSDEELNEQIISDEMVAWFKE